MLPIEAPRAQADKACWRWGSWRGHARQIAHLLWAKTAVEKAARGGKGAAADHPGSVHMRGSAPLSPLLSLSLKEMASPSWAKRVCVVVLWCARREAQRAGACAVFATTLVEKLE